MMDPIDPTTLPGLPAPFWFIQLFKVLGFTLHLVPMNLWYAGVLLAVWLHMRGGDHGRRFASRLMAQMPIVIALGINLGVVPLLFTQVAYYKPFYTATILMAWFWLAIIVLLVPAYYGVYLYASGLREGSKGLTPLKKTAGWAAAGAFLVIGFLFANGFSLMDHHAAWLGLWRDHNLGGAALGTALDISYESLWPRWLMLFGLALLTTAVWIVVDAAWFARRESDEYKRWAAGFARGLAMVGVVWFAAAGSWYVFRTWPAGLQETMFSGSLRTLTLATALMPGVPLALMLLRRNGPIGRVGASLIAVVQLAVLGLNATSRQIVQNERLRDWLDVSAQPTAVQWSPLVVFLVVFVAGLGVIGWMVVQVVKASRAPSP